MSTTTRTGFWSIYVIYQTPRTRPSDGTVCERQIGERAHISMEHRVDSTMAILFIYVPKSLPPSPSPPSSETKRIGNDKTSKSNKFSPPKLQTRRLAFDWRSPILQANSRSRRRRRLLESSIQVALRCLCCLLVTLCLSVCLCMRTPSTDSTSVLAVPLAISISLARYFDFELRVAFRASEIRTWIQCIGNHTQIKTTHTRACLTIFWIKFCSSETVSRLFAQKKNFCCRKKGVIFFVSGSATCNTVSQPKKQTF